MLGADETTVRRDTASNDAPESDKQIGEDGVTAANVAPPSEPNTPDLAPESLISLEILTDRQPDHSTTRQ